MLRAAIAHRVLSGARLVRVLARVLPALESGLLAGARR